MWWPYMEVTLDGHAIMWPWNPGRVSFYKRARTAAAIIIQCAFAAGRAFCLFLLRSSTMTAKGLKRMDKWVEF